MTGARIIVKFTVTNTAANPTLNVNSSGAKAIQYRGAAISAGQLAANRVREFVYDGTAYQLIGDLDTNTTYSNATQSTPGLMSAQDKVKLDGIDDQINQEIDKKQNKILYGETTPTADLGAIGDIYFQIEGAS